jgi:release factor glutamine methyltransferase
MPAQVSLEPVNSSFALPFHSRLKGSVDVIIFNPPYVPTLRDEVREAQDTRDIQGSWAGGSDGMNITDQFLDVVEVWNSFKTQHI